MANIFIADDQQLSREGLEKIINRTRHVIVGGCAASTISAVKDEMSKLLQKGEGVVDLLIADITWHGDESAGNELIEWCVKNYPSIKIMAISNFLNVLLNARRAGARGAMNKEFTAEQLVSTINDVLNLPAEAAPMPEDFGLTPTEMKVLARLARTDKEIATELSISFFTVKKHVTSVISKLGVQNRTAALQKGIQERLISA